MKSRLQKKGTKKKIKTFNFYVLEQSGVRQFL